MALSFCSDWGSFEHHLSPEIMSSFQQMHDDPEMAAEVLMTFDEIFPQVELQSYGQYPKRQKFSCGNYHNYSDFAPGFFDGYLPNPVLLPETLPEFLAPLPVASYSCDQHTPHESYTKNPTSRVSLSAQSIAARERRRKITEKTQELGKRIPGGNKLNTAEMFHAAFKYVKYLQAQVAVLQIMASAAEKEPIMHDTKELQDHLLASPLIQEKLYSEAKCMVPKQFLQTSANDREIQSKLLMLKDIHDQLQRINGA
ncbi:transcription factor bHLH53-like [Juglans microcarpa x Juglans regia]|uniref:transcription factor bHLH53-like n=1 Tax=Juglans microcarpa x Juglans regia TaxID=2249226 RepID=UPI001B7ED290|nr:transcription factor bHLH53-like [Juglans microcarpa x Juglans regia]